MKSAIVLFCIANCLAGSCGGEEQVPAKAGRDQKPRRQLYLLIGQSNMAGRGVIEDADRIVHARVFKFTEAETWAPAVDPLHFDKPAVAGVGLGLEFGKAMADADSTASIGLIPCAVGGTPLERWEKTGDLYQAAVVRTKKALPDGELKGILWHQGEADSRDLLAAKTYALRLSRMVRDLRTELGTPDVPFVAGHLGEFLADVEGEKKVVYWRVVNEQLDQVPGLLVKSAVVTSKGLKHKGDSVHFDSPSLRLFGRRYAQAMLTLRDPSGASSSKVPATLLDAKSRDGTR